MLLWLGVALLMVYLLIGFEVGAGGRKIRFLRDIAPIDAENAPPVTIIAAARNEERNIRAALQSLLRLNYPHYQILVVNDRSTDRTGTILEEMAKDDHRLEVLHVSELPAGWLGKNHALWEAGCRARGALLLFTDADVVLAPDVLSRAVSCLQQEGLDHLAATPEVRMPGTILNMLGLTFGFFLGLFTRPWKAADPKSHCHIGIGAFNLVRAAAYRQVGGHRAIALRPDDDLKLGKIIKKGGFRQQLVYGNGLIAVEWYASVREMVIGLEKNIFAGFDYRLGLAVGAVVFQLVAGLWPYLALLLTTGPTFAVYAATVVVISLIVADGARLHGYSPWYALGFPLTVGLLAFIIVRTLICTLSRGGIYWRGTFYPLCELRKNRV
ncbi:Glycosyltransferase, catalytic subunit of cellulose synthase and poly-beta-1,6-N-acetylglucosamine synthase [Geoalkalibacter ferrihydriticus]|uniref:Glycosyltransferase, catalytic subunit of cellulose synthase and poly-beta-1,6-N-acetylglucosamine synthase n=1 Tax=Geoalkalibacter ferrihydriticus TaxID=392333 RepID=A0A1G9RKH1_9BACT|nr:glycosyltransferase [Geoalkalibacter ferrihydriticus]SDM23560.1 Glycosyltransferase, catalytic subunit of cellulose synthase and poly-beta-1,6-N-acetylglucosamine synthase [Geoalkalibacter ferrihydriticus]